MSDDKENPAFYFLNINKPKGITSFDVIFKLRKLLNIKKIGHSGTLDPMAQGVMQVAVGRASRLLEYLNSDKEYIAEIQFGYSSTTLDIEGEITKLNTPCFTKNDLLVEIKNFEGEITQIPPKFSAIKVNGRKLCDIARKNPSKEIEIPKRNVKIFKIELLEFNFENFMAKIKVSCSKGTYIRTLAQDIARKLGTEAYLTNLTRTKAGNFKIENSIKIENLQKNKNEINPVDALELKEYKLNDREYEKIKNGVKIETSNIAGEEKTLMLTYCQKLVSIGILSDNTIKVKKGFS